MSWPVPPHGFLGSQASTAAAPADNDTYQISRSLRFNTADSTYLSRTPASAGNRKIWTFSAWAKRTTVGAAQSNYLLGNAQAPSGTNGLYLGFGSDTLFFGDYATSGWDWYVQSSSLYRDVSSWYHVVAQYDTTQATASERIKLYVNGVRLTAFDGASTYPTLNVDGRFNQASVEMAIGRLGTYNGNYFNGYITEVNFIDGQALTPSSFGETDAITGRWKAKAYAGTYGTNGFYLPFSNNSGVTATTLGKDNSTYRMLTTGLNGTTNGIQRGADLTGNANGKTGTISMWWDFTGASSGFQVLWSSRHNTTIGTSLNTYRDANGKIGISALNSAGTTILSAVTTTNVAASSGIYHVYMAWDMAVNNQVKIYVNGVDQALTISTFTNDTIQYVVPNHGLGGNLFGPFAPTTPGMVGQVYVNYATYLDPVTNISKFYGGTSTPIGIGTSGEIPSGSSPIVYLDGNATTILTNRGTGGNFAAYGTLATGTTYQGVGSHYNNWTPNNLSVTAGVGNDSLTDSPSNYGTISTTLVNDTYQISKSLRFNSLDSSFLSRTNSASPTNAIKYTVSVWVKRGSIGSNQNIIGVRNSGTDDTYLRFTNTDEILLGSYSGVGTDYNITSSGVFRDPSAWYHIVCVFDSANLTTADRAILYVNGVRQAVTSPGNGMWPVNSALNKINTASQGLNIGRRTALNDLYLDAYLTEFNFIDGQALTADSFGTRDINTYLWKPKAYTGTYGTNGFYLPFSDSSSTTTRNLLTYSEDFANGSWTNYQSTETSNAAVAPNGTTTADKLIPDAGALGGQFYRNYSAVDNTTYTFSVYAKAAEYAQLRLFIQKKATSATYDFADYDLSSATVTATYGSPTSTSIVAVGNGWHRISISSNVGTGGTATPSVNIQHIGSAGNGSNGILLWGAQLEDSGTLGPYLRTDASATASTLRLGSDSSVSTGGYNSWFANNFSVSAGPGNDSLVDSPTYYGTDTGVGGEARGDYATFNPLFGNTGGIITDGNLTLTHTGGANGKNALGVSSVAMSSGKWYCEFTNTAASNPVRIGIISSANTSIVTSGNPYFSQYSDGYSAYVGGGTFKENNNTASAITNFGGSSPVVNDVYMVAVDLDSNKVWFGRNGSWANSGNPATGTTETYSILSGRSYYFACNTYSGDQAVANFGQRPFAYTAPSGFRALRDYNKLPTPTGGEVRGNYCTLNPLFGTTNTIQDGGLVLTGTAAGTSQRVGTMAVSSGKWYYEVSLTTLPANMDPLVGFTEINNVSAVGQYPGQGSSSYSIYHLSTNTFLQKVNAGTFTNTNTAVASQGDILGVALDLSSGRIWFSKNGTWVDNGNPSLGTNAQFTGLSGTFVPAVRGTGGGTATTITCNFGQRPWAYDAPFGFLPLCTTLLPQPIVQKSSTYMDVVTYTGNSASSRSITGLGFSPDLVWLKSRSLPYSHGLHDTVRGASRFLAAQVSAAEIVNEVDGSISSFNSNGFTISSGSNSNNTFNTNNGTYVAWAWDESPIAGMDIVGFTSGASGVSTIGHSLGVAPKMIIVKGRGPGASNWVVYHASVVSATNQYLLLNSTAALSTVSGVWGSALPTSTNFGITNGTTVNASENQIAYCFAEVEGFSKFGSYTGNGSADGPFVYCGFRPRFVMIKRSDAGLEPWITKDTARSIYNGYDVELYPTLANAEGGPYSPPIMDYLSNGFKLRSTTTGSNASGGTYIFAAFAESPFKYARAR